MDKEFSAAEQNNLCALAQKIESNIPQSRVSNLGNQLIVFIDKSVATIYPLTADSVDIFAKDANDRNYDLKDMTFQGCIDFLKMLDPSNVSQWWSEKFPVGHLSASLGETTTSGAEPVSSAKAFSQPGQTTNRATQQSEREGWQRIGEETERDQSGRKDSRDYPFGEDPIGALDRSKRSDDRNPTLEQSTVQPLPQDLFAYLREMLSVEPSQVSMDDSGTITLNLDTAKIEIIPQGNAFGVRTYVNGEQKTETDKVPVGTLIPFLFSMVDKLQTLDAMEDESGVEDVSASDAFSVLRELASESGHSTDILRNKDLFDLKQGLVVSKSPFGTGRRFNGEDFNSGHTADNELSASLRGDTMHHGKPVSINEQRDVSKPYSDTLGGKKLVYLPGVGATLVDKSELPPQKKLNFDPEHGVILTDETTPTNRKNMWHFTGWH